MKAEKEETQALNVEIEKEIYLKLLNRCDITGSKLKKEVSLALRKHLGMAIPTIKEQIEEGEK